MKSWRRAIPVFASGLLIFFLTALPALAAEGGGEDQGASTGALIFRWLNFVLVFGGIGYLLAKHGGAVFLAYPQALAASITPTAAAQGQAGHGISAIDAL